MPLTDKSKAKESGFAQVRAAMQSFEGDVVAAEFGQWGGKLIDEETGKILPPREFLEIETVNVKVLEVTEELVMAIDEWNFRVNCSDFIGSFWVEEFLESADRAKLLIPDNLVGKRIRWRKVTLEAVDNKGVRKPKFDATNFVIDAVLGEAGTPPPASPKVIASAQAEEVAVEPAQVAPAEDPMEIACELAVGKTEPQFRSAISLHPSFVGSQLLPLAKAGAITQALVKEGRLVEVTEGNKTIYQKP